MPGAIATGKLANSPISAEPKAAARQVATNTAPLSIPASARIVGLTKAM
jgi:hypothetical protein